MWSSPGQACNFMPRVFEILDDEVCHGIRGPQSVTKQALRAPEFTHESRHSPRRHHPPSAGERMLMQPRKLCHRRRRPVMRPISYREAN
ncbi:unnamed protein product [Lasius platythorax]|uniref:Uncharacterized protein n=1 Tax=Lasius platythorax TaxID=488582 RepID=A0AAV2N3Z1_9HYME